MISNRCLLLTSWLLLAQPLLAAVETFEVEADPDTAFLPYATSVLNLDPEVQRRKPIYHSLVVVSEATAESPTGSYLYAYNPGLNEDVPSHLSWARYPNPMVMKEKPVGPNLSDVAGLLRHEALFVIGTAFRRDSAWFFRYSGTTEVVESLFAATGVDESGDGIWHGDFRHCLTSDYDFDGHPEMFFFLDPVRDKNPRVLFCLDPMALTVEWQIRVASPPSVVLDCRDSLNPGVILATGPRGQGSIDSIFDDAYGYLARVDAHGSVVFSTVKSTYPNYVGILPGRGEGSFLVNYWTVEEGAPGVEKILSHIEEVDGQGRVLRQNVDSALVNSVWKADFGDDGRDDIFVSLVDGTVRILNDSLIPVAEVNLGYAVQPIATIPRFDGRHSAAAISDPSGVTWLYDNELNKLARLSECDDIAVLQRGSNGEVLALAANDPVAGPRIIMLKQRGFWTYVAIFYRRYQLYVLVGMFTLLAALVVSNFYRRRARRDFSIISRQREDLEKTHEALKQAQQTIIAQEKYRQAQDIAGGFAHEIKNALFPADGALIKQERLLQDPSPNFERLMATYQTVRGALNRAINLTRLISTYARLDAEVRREPANIGRVLADVVRAYATTIEDRRLTLVTTGSPEIVTAVNVEHLRSVLNNLLVNSIDALKDRPNPTIRVAWSISNGRVVLDWCDNGCGIPVSNLPRVFDAFYSTKPTTGTGLGLSTVKRIVELYDGRIRAESEEGQSTSFHLDLPTF